MSAPPKISVVIPIYNVERYLRQCLDSVINQTLSDIEIICVNDGSPDACGEIIDEYAKCDSRVKAVHQENAGYGVAVNKGMKMARGEYIGIIESDDWVEPTMYERLYEQAKSFDADVAKCDFTFYKGNDVYVPHDNIAKVGAEDTCFTIKENPLIFMYHVSIWSAIYRREYMLQHQIWVEESRGACYQDMPFAALVYAKGARITILHDHLINYRAEEGQGSSTLRSDAILMNMPIKCEAAKQIFIEHDCWDEVRDVAYSHFYNCSVGMFFQSDAVHQKEFFKKLVALFGTDDTSDRLIHLPKERRILNMIRNNDYAAIQKLIAKKRMSPFLQKIASFRSSRCKKYRVLTLFGLKMYFKRS